MGSASGPSPAVPQPEGGVAALGRLIGEYGGSKKGATRHSWLGAWAGAVVTVPLLVVGLAQDAPALALAGGAGVALTALLTLRSRMRLRREPPQYVRVHERGLVHHVGDQAEEMPWSEVAELTVFGQTIAVSGAAVASISGCYLQRPDGHRAILTSHMLAGVEELVPHIVAEVTAAQLPQVLDRLGRGERVPFGALSVGDAGLDLDGRRLSWAEVGAVTVKDGKLTVSRASGGRWFHKDVILFPNLPLFLELIARYRR